MVGDTFTRKWLRLLREDLEHLSRGVPDTIYSGELEDALDEVLKVLRLLYGAEPREVEDLLAMTRSLRVRIASSGSFYQPGLGLYQSRLTRLLDTLSTI
ncbi:MAG: hypothetical protein GSR84_01000 [Desulfurococcales archaeon]|nr:hypothetical protein [Desulfurococcales archaeon]